MCSRCTILIAALGVTVLPTSLVAEEADKQDRVSGLKLVRTIAGHSDTVWSLAFSPDGKLLASAGDTTIRLWDTMTGKEIRQREMDGELASYAHFMEQGRILACGARAKQEVYWLAVPSLALRKKNAVPKEIQHFMGLFRDGKLLAGSTSEDLLFWDLTAGKKLWTASFHAVNSRPNFPELVFMAPHERIVAVTLDTSVSIREAANGKEMRRLKNCATQFAQTGWAAFSPTGKFLAVGLAMENSICLWDVATGESLRVIHWEFRQEPKPVRRRPAASAEEVQRTAAEQANPGVRFVTFSPDGKTVVAACADHKVRFWEVATGGIRHEAKLEAFRMAFSPDGRLLATNSWWYKGGDIRVWDWRDPGLDKVRRPTIAEVKRLWAELCGPDTAAAYRAIAVLAASPEKAIQQLGPCLKRVEPIGASELPRLVAELDDNDFEIRERAMQRLTALGTAAEPKLREALAHSPSSEVRQRVKELLRRLSRNDAPERLRLLRSVELLEYIGTPEAREVLERLASGAVGSVETEDARGALKRLRCGCPAPP